jgi:hypothetical protein
VETSEIINLDTCSLNQFWITEGCFFVTLLYVLINTVNIIIC